MFAYGINSSERVFSKLRFSFEYWYNAYPICLGNILKDFSSGNMKQIGLNGHVYDFSVDFESIDVDYILDIYKYLMIKSNIK